MSEAKFEAAVNVIRSLPKDGPYQPSNDMMLKFYGLYKQATEGPCKEPKPSFYEVVKGYKWKAWSSLGNMSKTDAMEQYVVELKKIIETMSYSDKVADFIDAVGPFYEYIQVLQLKNTDTNHNTTEKYFEKKSDDSFEVIPQCNGKEDITLSPVMNGITNKDANHVSDQEIEQSPVKTISINENTAINGHVKVEDSLKKGLLQKGTKRDSEDESDLSESDNADIKKLHNHSSAAKKLTSDTDSDDEYSEPAETPELLHEKQKARMGQRSYTYSAASKYDDELWIANGIEENIEYCSYSPKLEIITYGGGDANGTGKIRLTDPLSNQQGVSSMNTTNRCDPNDGMSSSSHTPRRASGAGGGRRRRDSDRGRISESINSQLILLLQKIHQDLQAVVLRLDSLEAQALNQHQEVCSLCQRRLGRSYSPVQASWWPFPELSPRSTFFLLTWPLILHGAVKFLLLIRSRRRNK